MISSGAQRELSNNPNYYKNLLEYSKKVPSPSTNQIDLDLKRTFPDEPICMTEGFLVQLRNILICYSIRNSTVGYCQGMNFIVGKFSVQQFDNDKFSTKLRNSWRYEHDNTINSLCCPNQYSLYKNTPCSMYHISLWNTDLPKSKHELTLNASALKYE